MKKRSFLEKLFKKGHEKEESDLKQADKERKEMIQGIVELSETTVKEIMVPRIDVVSLAVDTQIPELLQKVYNCGHSRVPVYRDTIDNIVGILYAKDLLRYLVYQDKDISIEEIIRPPYFVPESKRINSLLREFKRRKVHIAIAVDEYGGTSGIVCMEDIIEEIVGDIQDEFDNETEEILEIGENVFLCDARVAIEDLNKKFLLSLPDDDFDTLGGFVFHLFGKIPVKFEKVMYNNLTFIIQDMDGHKINSVKLVIGEIETPEKEYSSAKS